MSAVAGRRTYTEDELQAALRDIQSGKLGTRRAAVIYGIPRSTLRNKVYKLALERERESHLNSAAPLKIDEEEAMDDDKELSGAEEEKEVEKALQAPLLSVADLLRFSNLENPDALKALIQRGRENHEWPGAEQNSIAPYIQNLLVASGGMLPGQKPSENELNTAVPEFVKRMIAEEQLLKEQLKHQQNNGDVTTIPRPSPSNSVASQRDKTKSESDMETDDSPSNVILKIPSFKPTTSKNGCDLYRPSVDASLVSPPVTSDSSSPPILPGKGMTLKDVKEVIAKSISQKFQQSPEPLRHPMMDMDFKRGGFTPPLGGISVIKTQQDLNRPYPPPQQKPQPNTSTPAQGGKGTRPKRGKYRNYDRDSLVEAVRAVQRGEMSVHRAGSYYGVPHSTLEYKVKERHLMRPRKRDPKPNPVDEKIASLKQNDLRNTPDKIKPVIKPPQKFPPTSPNGMKIPMFDPNMAPMGYSPAPFPFWPHPSFHHIPMEYGRNTAFPTNPDFFASQMMQKMQEDRSHSNATPSAANSTPTLAKSARQIAESLLEGPGANGSFLDGIIRSSLESGVPIIEDKSIKEEKNVAPENMSNKALIDQLCRNSRLTPLPLPLPKPNLTEPSSSGDESYRKSSSPINFATGNSKDGSMSGIEGETPPPPSNLPPAEIQTIELSNDSNEAREEAKATPPGRIYLKQELTKPENLKPEMLMRFRDVLHDVDRNGVGEPAAGSASESDAAQD